MIFVVSNHAPHNLPRICYLQKDGQLVIPFVEAADKTVQRFRQVSQDAREHGKTKEENCKGVHLTHLKNFFSSNPNASDALTKSQRIRQLGKVYQVRYSKQRVVCDVERPAVGKLWCTNE